MAARRAVAGFLVLAMLALLAAPLAAENWTASVWSMSTWASGLMMFYYDTDTGAFTAALRTAWNSGRTDYDLYYLEGTMANYSTLRGQFIMVNADRSEFGRGTVTLTMNPSGDGILISYDDERGMDIRDMDFTFSRASDEYWNGIAGNILTGIREAFGQ
ncbi:MAG TPA: hypothetical protein PKW82_10065 [Spirochaetales bacterium]|nr:hypothetical protein [Spirochaetales bacterium]